MLSVGWLVAAVLIAVLLTMWVTFTLTRLDRLHARVDAAWAALDAQLVRRAAGLLGAAESPGSDLHTAGRERYAAIAHAALNASDVEERQRVENSVGRGVAELIASDARIQADAHAELSEAAARVLIARRFYNDAVRDTRTLRARRMPRLLRLAGHRAMPQFFDIDETVPNRAEPPSDPDGAGVQLVPEPTKEAP